MSAYHVIDDSQLVVLIKANDREAFSVIYKRYAAALYRFARRNIQVKEDCEELVQDVFKDIWERRERLNPISSVNAYLFRMMRNKVVRYVQHNATRRKYEEHFQFFEAVFYQDEDSETDRALSEMIEHGLSQLPERCRLAVKLRLDENLSNGDIAKRMNIQKDTVENYMVTALNHLRAYFQENYRPA